MSRSEDIVTDCETRVSVFRAVKRRLSGSFPGETGAFSGSFWGHSWLPLAWRRHGRKRPVGDAGACLSDFQVNYPVSSRNYDEFVTPVRASS